MDYYKLLNFKKEPFSNSPDPEFFYRTRLHTDCLQKLEVAVRLRRGLNVVVGEVGTGKTTLCRQLIQRFAEEESVEAHLVLDPDLGTRLDTLKALHRMLTDQDPESRNTEAALKEDIKKALFKKGVDQDKYVILIIDEGQKLSSDFLEILREFLNYETNEYKLLQIVIFAQQEFAGLLREHENFADRINLNYPLGPLDFEDTRSMIRFRLSRAASDYERPTLFSDSAFRAIYEITDGYPRKIVNLCHQVVLAMIVQNRTKADGSLVRGVAGMQAPRRGPKSVHPLVAGALGAVLAVAVMLAVMALTGFGLGRDGEKNVVREQPPVLEASAPESAGGVEEPVSPPVQEPVEASVPAEPEVPAPPDIGQVLGQVTVRRADSLSKIVSGVYGRFNVGRLPDLERANPHIRDLNMIEVGDVINLPVLFLTGQAPPSGTILVRVASETSLDDAYARVRKYPASRGKLQILPYFTPADGLRFDVILDRRFDSEDAAGQAVSAMPREYAKNADTIRAWPPDTVFYTRPGFISR